MGYYNPTDRALLESEKMKIEVKDIIEIGEIQKFTWERIEELPEGHQTHPPEDPEERKRLAELIKREREVLKRERELLETTKAVVGLQGSAEHVHARSFEQVKELVRVRGGRPRGTRKGLPVERVPGSKSVINYPVAIAQNHTISDTAKAIYPLVVTLAWEKGYTWGSNSYFAKELWGKCKPTTLKKRAEKAGKALRELAQVGYIQMIHRSTGKGNTNYWVPTPKQE